MYCAFIDPLHVNTNYPMDGYPANTEFGMGPLHGGGAFETNYIAHYRNLYAHCMERAPLTYSIKHAHANNLHYNHGRRNGGGVGAAVNFTNSGAEWTNSVPMLSNVVRNLIVRGPENDSELALISVNGSLPANSLCYAEGNVQHGFATPASQNDFFRSTVSSGFKASSVQLATLPFGWGEQLEGCFRIAENPLAPLESEKLNFSNLVHKHLGVKPKYRPPYSRVEAIRKQIEAAISGVRPAPQAINDVSEVGWMTIPELTIADPTNPGAWWHTPPPLDSSRDDILLTGTFSNGRSKVGYSQILAWLYEQHLFVGGF
jgi:hypothetical protein